MLKDLLRLILLEVLNKPVHLVLISHRHGLRFLVVVLELYFMGEVVFKLEWVDLLVQFSEVLLLVSNFFR